MEVIEGIVKYNIPLNFMINDVEIIANSAFCIGDMVIFSSGFISVNLSGNIDDNMDGNIIPKHTYVIPSKGGINKDVFKSNGRVIGNISYCSNTLLCRASTSGPMTDPIAKSEIKFKPALFEVLIVAISSLSNDFKILVYDVLILLKSVWSHRE